MPQRDEPSTPSLEAGVVQVWKASLDVAGVEVLELERLLAQGEREWMRRLRFDRDRRRYGVGRLWLRRLLAGYVDRRPEELGFRLNANGKPSLAPPDDVSGLRFNVSFSGDTALCAVAVDTEVGVDVERVRSDVEVEKIATSFFAGGERRVLRGLPPEPRVRAFFRCWTRKEAYVKALGLGLSVPLDSFDVALGLEKGLSEPCLIWGPAGTEWSLQDLDVEPGYAAALVIEGPPASVRRVAVSTSCSVLTLPEADLDQ